MRMSRLFFETLREVPAAADTPSHQLLLRAGLVHQVAAGIFEFLPLGLRAKRKIEAILRQEMERIDGQEVQMPVVHPAELWQRSGRWYAIGPDMARLKDRNDRDLCLGMTHEEPVTDLAASMVRSYRDLPFMVYQIQTKFRDEPRPRAGLIRVREFTMKDGYSFHRDFADLDAYYPRVYEAYYRMFRRCGLEVVAVASDTGMMGGTMAHEFMALSPIGEDTLLLCDACGYKANRQIALFRKPQLQADPPAALEEVHTPRCASIEDLAAFLSVSPEKIVKAVFMVGKLAVEGDDQQAQERLIVACLRGDMELNETKLANALKCRGLRPAHDSEIRAAGIEPGFGSPVGMKAGAAIVIADDLVPAMSNFVCGANKADYHLRNANYQREFAADVVADIAAAAEGNACCACGRPLRSVRGIEVGNIFKLGTKYSAAMGAAYLDEKGASHPIVMGCYGAGSDRVLASVIEEHHDEAGIQWPVSVAPYELVLVSLVSPGKEEEKLVEDVYQKLAAAGVEVLYDDRNERAGVKFNDADLLGFPLRLTAGPKGLKTGTLELKIRRTGEVRPVPIDQVVEAARQALDEEWALLKGMLDQPFPPM